MLVSLLLVTLASSASCSVILNTRQSNAKVIDPGATPDGASGPIPESFVAYSIEFSSFPEFAGNLSSPNTFSNNLLDNLAQLQGTKPYIRVGGNTQDYALYNASLPIALNGTVIPSRSPDYPYLIDIGPSYFESYLTLPGVKFIHGFNLAKNSTSDHARLLESVPLVCKALSHGNLLYWQLGNEPDLFKTASQGILRPRSYDEAAYVAEWQNLTTQIMGVVAEACPGLSNEQWVAPSFGGVGNSLRQVPTWAAGLNSQGKVVLIDSHNYIGGATQPGISLRGTLMNHTRTRLSVDAQVAVKNSLAQYSLPFILGETNSLYNQGAPGLSNSFGAALWNLDFALYCASQDIKRVHMHQGTNYRYQSWQPVTTALGTKGTKAPYYGNVATAAALGDLRGGDVRVKHIALAAETDAGYAVYAKGVLRSVVIVNMVPYNASSTVTRGSETYSVKLPVGCTSDAVVQRLLAPGSDVIDGATFNGVSYDLALDDGKPVVVEGMKRDEGVTVEYDGELAVDVPWSSAAVVQPSCV
ncbi:hypothetical protein EJ05DRAFT_485297 [Pseudovirgaria hyperparasitica]|uniref:Beta-glucuronidase C-terminal domain-containing protein n=1 Tax=Pseudovirgaria hyperparasitica TaxID=470096 RepID=A0A6A6WCG5_9PEZI|nr:uncharacterized protein EJ05DRAFT_485297 [Pseudovirgaria hyperparasitica]KAF2759257.1 hypothetical protein EJ05DRAFT_485297 [Pseudovirgaria hyperparasitica]